VALIAGPATAADMAVKAPLYKAPIVAPWSWTGFYVGANLGYSWGRSSNDWNFVAFNAGAGPGPCLPAGFAWCAAGSDSSKLNGAIGGLQAGYNWQTGNYLAGIETDIQISGQKGSNIFTGAVPLVPGNGLPPGIVAANHSEKLLWLGTLRGRAGITFDRWLVYATGGLAYGEVKAEGAATATGAPGGNVAACLPNGCPFLPFGSWSNSRTKAGWTAGVGVEGAIGNNWTVKLEYLYVDLGNVDTTFATLPGCYGNGSAGAGAFCLNTAAGTGTIHSRVTDNIFRVGINYKFAGPVVANY
jgi:outer membrane immunogenic protein